MLLQPDKIMSHEHGFLISFIASYWRSVQFVCISYLSSCHVGILLSPKALTTVSDLSSWDENICSMFGALYHMLSLFSTKPSMQMSINAVSFCTGRSLTTIPGQESFIGFARFGNQCRTSTKKGNLDIRSNPIVFWKCSSYSFIGFFRWEKECTRHQMCQGFQGKAARPSPRQCFFWPLHSTPCNALQLRLWLKAKISKSEKLSPESCQPILF